MTEATRPFLLFHPRFVRKFETHFWEYQMNRATFEREWWKGEGCFVIDADCRRFDLIDIVNKGVAFTFWNIGRNNRTRLLKVEYQVGNPVQLTFDQARDLYVKYVCEHRWWSASYETERQFRERNASYDTWEELLKPVSLAGRLP